MSRLRFGFGFGLIGSIAVLESVHYLSVTVTVTVRFSVRVGLRLRLGGGVVGSVHVATPGPDMVHFLSSSFSSCHNIMLRLRLMVRVRVRVRVRGVTSYDFTLHFP